MAHTHEFDCKVCGAHLDSSEELDRHNSASHPDSMKASQPNRGMERGMERPRQPSPSDESGQRRS